MSIEISGGADELAAGAAARIERRLGDIQAEGRTPLVALTGGTIAGQTYAHLAAGIVDWTNVTFYWGDERFVPAGHVDRNDRQAHVAFLDRLAVPTDNIVAMPAHDCSLSVAAAADQYAERLPSRDFDLVLLGVGPDGHVASLFPGHPELHETARAAVEVLDSPKPPPVRTTLTFPRLNAAHSVWFIVSGETKAGAVARAIDGGDIDVTPAAGVHGHAETLWLVDRAAATAT